MYDEDREEIERLAAEQYAKRVAANCQHTQTPHWLMPFCECYCAECLRWR